MKRAKTVVSVLLLLAMMFTLAVSCGPASAEGTEGKDVEELRIGTT